ncbi:MAG: endonuclease/exonuclease/phosphatase family protein [bacterium]
MDALRWRRILGWLAGLRRPRSDQAHHRAIWWASLGFLGVTVVAACLLWTLGDVWWPVTAFLFGPRWVLALPLAALVPAAALLDRALLLPLAFAALLLAGPVIELRTGWRAFAVSPDPDRDLRVVTYNVAGGSGLASTAAGMAQRWNADVLLFQECGGSVREEVRELAGPAGEGRGGGTGGGRPGVEPWLGAGLAGWSGDVRAQLCALSRFPILEVDEMDRSALEAAGGSGQVATYRLDVEGTEVRVTNVHLETPRGGFELLRAGRVFASVDLIREKSFLRRIELQQARRWAEEGVERPRIVAGDFNTPVESRAYRAAWSGWTNVYNRVGRGYGGTRLNGWIRPRIDHVLVDQRWAAVRARLGEDLGSDHLPVIATIRLSDSGRSSAEPTGEDR